MCIHFKITGARLSYRLVPARKVHGQGKGDEVYEFTKMAVAPAHHRKGIAEALSYAAFDKAINLGAKKIILYSQTGLVAAINLYKKLGFAEVPLESNVYQRSDIKMERPVYRDGSPKVMALVNQQND